MRRQIVNREIARVAGHDQVGPAFNRRSQHMAVAGIRQVQASGSFRVSCHNGIGKVPVHHCACAFQHGGGKVGTVSQNAPYPFRVDIGAP